MSWTKSEHQIVKEMRGDLKAVVNALKGDLNSPDEPGMVETLRNVDIRVDTFVETHTITHRWIRRLLAGIGILALVALLLHWGNAAGLVLGLIELAVKLVT